MSGSVVSSQRFLCSSPRHRTWGWFLAFRTVAVLCFVAIQIEEEESRHVGQSPCQPSFCSALYLQIPPLGDMRPGGGGREGSGFRLGPALRRLINPSSFHQAVRVISGKRETRRQAFRLLSSDRWTRPRRSSSQIADDLCASAGAGTSRPFWVPCCETECGVLTPSSEPATRPSPLPQRTASPWSAHLIGRGRRNEEYGGRVWGRRPIGPSGRTPVSDLLIWRCSSTLFTPFPFAY